MREAEEINFVCEFAICSSYQNVGETASWVCAQISIAFGEQMRDGKIPRKKTCFDEGKIGFCQCMYASFIGSRLT